MVELFDRDQRQNNRKSSKGNQLKWEKNGIWYKADYTGYEGLAEYVISALLGMSSFTDSEFVAYSQEEIHYNLQIFMGVSCKNFLSEGEQLITLERLFHSAYGIGMNRMIYSIESHEERLRTLVNKTIEITGLRDFGRYMSKVLTIDAFFLNEDRHSHNIAVILGSDGHYRYCPLFDHGAGLLADTTMDYPLLGDTYELMSSVRAKTFCEDFDEQLEIAEKLYGRGVRFDFTKEDAEHILDNSFGYDKAITDRVRDIIYEQMRKYAYLLRRQ